MDRYNYPHALSSIPHPELSGVWVEFWQITPEVAAILLTNNKGNRNPNEAVIGRYAQDKIEGQWPFIGDTLRFDDTGRLIDGQNRLRAQVRAGVTTTEMVVIGLPPEAQEFVDHGWKRTMAHVLSMRGEKTTATLAPLLRRIAVWHEGGDMDMRTQGRVTERSALEYLDGPDQEIIRRALEHGERVRRALTINVDGRRRAPITSALAAFAYYRFARLDEDAASEFMHVWESGVRGIDDPLKALDTALRNLGGYRGFGDMGKHQLALIFMAWNKWRLDKPVKVLRWSRENDMPEPL